MRGKLFVLKNMIWALSILICLGVLFVGLIVAAVSPYDGSGQIPEPGTATQAPDAQTAGNLLVGSGVLNTVPETADGGQSYLDSLTFLCDSALIGLRDYGLLTGGNATRQVWGSTAGNIPATNLSQCVIRYPGDGTEMTAVNAAQASKPAVLVISLGMDSLAQTTQESFIEEYTALLNALHAASPDTKLVCCSISSVTMDYSGVDGLSTAMVSEANQWIRQVCINTGVSYLDLASAVCDSSGTLFSEYTSANGKTLNSSGLNAVLDYIKTHMV